MPEDKLKRPSWMVDEPTGIFEISSKQPKKAPSAVPSVSSRELNPDIRATAGLPAIGNTTTNTPSTSSTSEVRKPLKDNSWQTMKVKRVYEQAERENRPVKEVALERFGSLEEFYQLEEGFKSRRSSASSTVSSSSKGRGFKAPKELKQSQNTRQELSSASSNTRTKIPSASYHMPSNAVQAALSKDELNQMKARLLRAKLSKDPEYSRLHQEYDEALEAETKQSHVVVLPTIDSDGKMIMQSNMKNMPSDDSIQSLLLEEKSSKHNYDSEYANRISRDSSFKNSLEYLDEESDKFTRQRKTNSGHDQQQQRHRKNAMIGEYQKMNEIMNSCAYCFKDEKTSEVPAIASGYRVYLGIPLVQPISHGHSIIVPHEHQKCTLACGDDEWDEIRNFMKSMLKMAHAQGKGVIFFETAMHYRKHGHAYIECVPVPYDVYDTATAYFKGEILRAAPEWSQHRKLIDTTEKGIRRSLVKELPYFHVWFGLEKSFGTVIEDESTFPPLFGREVIAGMTRLKNYDCKPRKLSENELEIVKKKFIGTYRQYDWTEMIADT